MYCFGKSFDREAFDSVEPLHGYFSDIDPDDESTESYGRDIFNYVLIRDAKYIVTSDDIISKDDPKACPSLYRTI